MPLLALTTSVLLPDDEKDTILTDASRAVAEVLGKPEQYVMVILEEGAICLGGKTVPAVFGDLRSIGGLNADMNHRLSERLCALLAEKLDVGPENIYLNFASVARDAWGWNGGTFA